jgi:hypothetical protein
VWVGGKEERDEAVHKKLGVGWEGKRKEMRRRRESWVRTKTKD